MRKVFRNRELDVQTRILKHDAEPLPDFGSTFQDIEAKNRRRSRRGRKQSRKDSEKCRLAAPIRAEQAEDLSLGDVERHTGQRFVTVVGMGQVFYFNDCHIVVPPLRALDPGLLILSAHLIDYHQQQNRRQVHD